MQIFTVVLDNKTYFEPSIARIQQPWTKLMLNYVELLLLEYLIIRKKTSTYWLSQPLLCCLLHCVVIFCNICTDAMEVCNGSTCMMITLCFPIISICDAPIMERECWYKRDRLRLKQYRTCDILGTRLLTRIKISTWISDGVCCFRWGVIIILWNNSNGDLTKTPVQLRFGWMIAVPCLRGCLLVHALIPGARLVHLC